MLGNARCCIYDKAAICADWGSGNSPEPGNHVSLAVLILLHGLEAR